MSKADTDCAQTGQLSAVDFLHSSLRKELDSIRQRFDHSEVCKVDLQNQVL